MTQPVWITPAGNLDPAAEGKFYSLALVASSSSPNPIRYKIIAGNLPSNMSVASTTGILAGIPKNPVVGASFTTKFVVRAYTETMINGVVVIEGLADRTFNITVAPSLVGPEFITPAGQIAQIYDGSLITDLQIQFTAPNIGTRLRLISGSLPIGLTIDSSGRIAGLVQPLVPIDQLPGFSRDGQGYDIYPFDFSLQGISQNYEFKLELSDTIGNTTLRTYSIYVWSRSIMTADTTLITADNTFVTADSAPGYVPVLLNPLGSIGRYANDNWFAYKFEAIDFEDSQISYIISSSSPSPLSAIGLTLDINSGWLYGYIPNLGIQENTYDFEIQVYKSLDPTYISNPYSYSLSLTGQVDTEIVWLTDSYLGSIFNGSISTFNIEASNPAGLALIYELEEGSASALPQGLRLLSSGNIVGRVSFDTFALDGGSTTFDADIHNGPATPTTFDMVYTFTITVTGANGLINSSKTFSIRVIREYNEPYNNLYIQAMPPVTSRDLVHRVLKNQDILPQNLIYRADDPNFGVAKNVTYYHAFGLTAATLSDYYSALTENHYWKTLTLGEIKTAQALDDNDNVLYEVVYSQIVDNLVNNDGVSVGKSVLLAYPVDNGNISTVYPNSLQNMRTQVVDTVGQVSNILPRWMTSKQADGTVLGFTPAWIIAYTKPGEAAQIAYNIVDEFNINNLNQFDFEVDRYELDTSQTLGWIPADTVEINNITGDGTQVTVTFDNQYVVPFVPDQTIVLANVVPTAYNGVYQVDSCDFTQVVFSSNITNAYVSGGTVSSNGEWDPLLSTMTTFDVEYHYQITAVSGGTGYQAGDIIEILGSLIGGIDGVNDVTITISTVDGLGAPVSAFYTGVATAVIDGQTYINVPGTNVTGTGSSALWSLLVIPGVPTVFDKNSMEFIGEANINDNSQLNDKYLVFPNRTILG